MTSEPSKQKQAKRGPGCGTDGSKTENDKARSKAAYLTESLTSDPRVKDSGKLNADEKAQMLEKAGQAKALVLTMVHQDGTTQLDPEQVSRAEGTGSQHRLGDEIKTLSKK